VHDVDDLGAAVFDAFVGFFGGGVGAGVCEGEGVSVQLVMDIDCWSSSFNIAKCTIMP